LGFFKSKSLKGTYVFIPAFVVGIPYRSEAWFRSKTETERFAFTAFPYKSVAMIFSFIDSFAP
jgi:hypothetical protein